MKRKKIIKILFCDFLICVFLLTAVGSYFSNNTASAGSFEPYTKTFTISAYYSPLPCQKKYTTGSYEGDIRLNGSGVNGADGTAVYPGMIAAPKTYPFGTKMYIPGLGTVSVHDRGGAIVESNGEEGVYDRLDVWMGYGDKGLARALNWGKRNVSVTVYGVDPGIKENIFLTDYSPDEAIPNACIVNIPDTNQFTENVKHVDSAAVKEPEVKLASSEPADPVEELDVDLSESLETDLRKGDEGEAVKKLQQELTNLNFYRGEINGVYDEITEHAVFKFQQSQLLAGDKNSAGAGIFGPKTRDRMNEIISSKNYTKVLVAQTTAEVAANSNNTYLAENSENKANNSNDGFTALKSELDFGIVDSEVRILQEFLRDQGYFDGKLITDYFGPITQEAVLQFQLDNEIITSSKDQGAGRVGPATLELINSLA